MKKQFLILAVLFALLIQSSNFVVTKTMVDSLNPYLIASLRAIIPALVIPLLFLFKKPLIAKTSKDIRLLIICALGNFVWFPLLSTYGLSLTSASEASLIFSFSPIFTIILCHFYLNDKLTIRRSIGVILAAIGVLIIISPSLGNLSKGNWIGDILVLIATVGSGISYVASVQLVRSLNSYSVISFSVLIGGIILSFVFVFGGFWRYVNLMDLKSWIGVIYIGIFGVLISNGLILYAVRYASAITLSSTTFITPFLSIILAVFILDESISLIDILSGIIILTGVYFTKYEKSDGLGKFLKGGDIHESNTSNSKS